MRKAVSQGKLTLKDLFTAERGRLSLKVSSQLKDLFRAERARLSLKVSSQLKGLFRAEREMLSLKVSSQLMSCLLCRVGAVLVCVCVCPLDGSIHHVGLACRSRRGRGRVPRLQESQSDS